MVLRHRINFGSLNPGQHNLETTGTECNWFTRPPAMRIPGNRPVPSHASAELREAIRFRIAGCWSSSDTIRRHSRPSGPNAS